MLLFLDPGSGMGKKKDPGSGINIPDPQHWLQAHVTFDILLQAHLTVDILSKVHGDLLTFFLGSP